MTETELNALLAGITPANEAARAAAHAHWGNLAKPLGGLGRLETMLEDAAALTGSAELDLSRRVVVVLCADNGVVAQGVSQTGQEVTRAVAENLAMRRTSVCQMARTAHCDVLPVDMGMAGEPVPGVRSCRIAAGTADKILDHPLGHLIVADDAVFQRPDHIDVRGVAPEHRLCVLTDLYDPVFLGVHRYDRRLLEHDALAFHKNQKRGGSEIHPDIFT